MNPGLPSACPSRPPSSFAYLCLPQGLPGLSPSSSLGQAWGYKYRWNGLHLCIREASPGGTQRRISALGEHWDQQCRTHGVEVGGEAS